jgi:hypothetical protein
VSDDETAAFHILGRRPDDTWCLVVELPSDYSRAEHDYVGHVAAALRESGPDNPVVLAKPEHIKLYWLRDCKRHDDTTVPDATPDR